jgi:hypothetical protein
MQKCVYMMDRLGRQPPLEEDEIKYEIIERRNVCKR